LFNNLINLTLMVTDIHTEGDLERRLTRSTTMHYKDRTFPIKKLSRITRKKGLKKVRNKY